VWLRIHAQDDSKYNDSVYVQFNDSVNASGSPTYRIGTADGLLVNLWTCSACPSTGWGWQNQAYWLPDTGEVWFANGGSHTIRVQVREDGAQVDQIVISPAGYLDAAPGSVSGDTTIVPKPGSPPPVGGATEQVIYANDASVIRGNWNIVADPTAAAGTKIATVDAGARTVSGPLANPADFFEAPFQATAGTRYRVWLRIHAQDESKFNDSVYVQFDASVDASGSPIYRTGSTDGLLVNLWTCSTCASTGWGWQNQAYWLPDTGEVWFATTGPHTIRVQVREDGAQIDQIVISPSTYVDAAPGSVSNDTTIVPKPGSGSGPPPPSGPAEVVVYAADLAAAALHGSWTTSADSTAAGGLKATTPDAGFPTTDGALATPSDYFDITFSAAANTPYHLWLRLRALNDSRLNDSVWVQFSDAQIDGSDVYSINSSSGLLVNLESCYGCGDLRWGWVDSSWWAQQPATVTFRNSGTHTLRIQMREDGVAVDQIVLSSQRFLTAAPGLPKDDGTIVAKP
jgi:hypothetical protein